MFNGPATVQEQSEVVGALCSELDREQIMDAQLGAGVSVLSPGLFGPNIDCSINLDEAMATGRDPDKADELLIEAGYEKQGGQWVKDMCE